MTNYTNAIWSLFSNLAEPYIKKSQVTLKKEASEKFKSTFKDLYDYTKDNYMNEKVENLDLHKIAAITAISISIIQPLELNEDLQKDDVFVLNDILAISTALSSLQYFLNTGLDHLNKTNGLDNKKIEKMCLMETINCKDDFSFILSRNLFFHRKGRSFSEAESYLKDSILDLAAVFYLLEYVTLNENQIDVKNFKELTGTE